MSSQWKCFCLCFVIDLIIFYMPVYLAYYIFNYRLPVLFGVWGMNLDLLFKYGYVFIFIIVFINYLAIKLIQALPKLKNWIKMVLVIPLVYHLFIFISTIFLATFINLIYSPFSFDEFIADFKKILNDGYNIGIYIIVFSPVTYFFILNHWINMKRYRLI